MNCKSIRPGRGESEEVGQEVVRGRWRRRVRAGLGVARRRVCVFIVGFAKALDVEKGSLEWCSIMQEYGRYTRATSALKKDLQCTKFKKIILSALAHFDQLKVLPQYQSYFVHTNYHTQLLPHFKMGTASTYCKANHN